MSDGKLRLEVRRVIRAPAWRIFDAWTTPEQLLRWWGPKNVTCIHAELDLVVGGSYRLGNQLDDGSVVYIHGEFLELSPPHGLLYTWGLEPDAAAERVRVQLREGPDGTEVTITHERIGSQQAQRSHEAGWLGCLDGLAQHLRASGAGT